MKTMLLFIEAFGYLAWGRVLISVPFAKVAPSLGAAMQETSEARYEPDIAVLTRVHDAIRIASRHTPWDSKCLVRAIAALKMLERRQIESTLYLGIARDDSRQMIAHAWLRSGPFYITGAEEMSRFEVVGTFAKHVK
ncbi:lasso peptide biosynthesis B2 protein [Paenibacillus rigui]